MTFAGGLGLTGHEEFTLALTDRSLHRIPDARRVRRVRGGGMIASFIMASLDGYFEGEKPWDLDWHRTDEEFNDFAAEQLTSSTRWFSAAQPMRGWPSTGRARKPSRAT